MTFQSYHALFLIFLFSSIASGVLLVILYFCLRIKNTVKSIIGYSGSTDITKEKETSLREKVRKNSEIKIKSEKSTPQKTHKKHYSTEILIENKINTVFIEEDNPQIGRIYETEMLNNDASTEKPKTITQELKDGDHDNCKANLVDNGFNYEGTVVLTDVDEEFGYVGSDNLVDI